MRIGIFTDTYLPYVSGVVTAVESLKLGLEELGHEVFIISINGDKDRRKYVLKDNVVKIPGIKMSKIVYDYYVKLDYPFKAQKIVKSLNLDIVHTHTEFMIGMFGKSMAKKLNIPVVHTFHTMYEDCVDYITRGYFPKFGKKVAKGFVKAFLSKTVLRVIAVGEKPKRLLKDKYHIKQPVTVIPNGIDVLKFHAENYSAKEVNKLKRKFGLKDSDFVILWVGRLGYEKKIQFLVRCHKEILKHHNDVKLLIVGGGPEEEALRNLANDLGIASNVIFVGKIPNKDVGKYYRLGSVFATASDFETQGLTVVEAFAASLPVLAFNDLSFTKIIKNNKNGIIFKNEKEYINAVLKLYSDRDKLKDMAVLARKESDNYTLKAFAEKVVKEYELALKEYKVKHKNYKTDDNPDYR